MKLTNLSANVTDERTFGFFMQAAVQFERMIGDAMLSTRLAHKRPFSCVVALMMLRVLWPFVHSGTEATLVLVGCPLVRRVVVVGVEGGSAN